MKNKITYAVKDVVPHSAPMILIDSIESCIGDHISSTVTIQDSSLFIDEKGDVPIWVGIEYMAQTVAAYAGIKAIENNNEVKLGFLLGTRKYEAKREVFENKKSFVVHACKLYEDSGLGGFGCEIYEMDKDVLYAKAQINVFQPDDADDFLNESK